MSTAAGPSPDGLDEGLAVVLRPCRDSDAPRWLEVGADPAYRQFGAPAFVTTPEDVAGAVAELAEAREAWDQRQPGSLAIAEAADPSVFLGDVSWRWTGGEPLGVAELGYAVHPDARGRGVGRTAVLLLTRWLLDPDGRGLARVQLDHSTENPASCRVALAAGLEREGVRRGFLPLRGPDGTVRRHDVCLHGTTVAPALPR